jgi:hypothetical protein
MVLYLVSKCGRYRVSFVTASVRHDRLTREQVMMSWMVRRERICPESSKGREEMKSMPHGRGAGIASEEGLSGEICISFYGFIPQF